MNNFTQEFVIEDLYYIPTGEYMPVLTRPYIVNPTGSDIENFKNKLDNNNIGAITPELMSGFASSFLQPSAVGFNSTINQNWVTTKRFIFFMKVAHMSRAGILNKYYLQGFTNYDGITPNGIADPYLIHNINTITETSTYSYQTPMGVVQTEKLNKIYNVITNSVEFNNDIYLQRPTDIYSNISTIEAFNNMQNSDNYITSVENKQFQLSSLDNRSVCSNINNNVPTRYLTSVFNAGLMSRTENDFSVSDNFNNPMITSSGKLLEPSSNENMFIRTLSLLEGFKIGSSKFKYSTLLQIDQSIDSRFKLINITKQYINPLIAQTPSTGEYWHGQDMITLKAYNFIEAAVAMSLRYGFNKMYFIASNITDITGMAKMIISDFNSLLKLEQQDFNKLLALFETNFMNEVFLDEVISTNIPLHMEVYVDIVGTTKINLSYAGYPATWYTIPTFANSQFSPVVTINKDSFDNMSMMMDNTVQLLSNKSVQNNVYI